MRMNRLYEAIRESHVLLELRVERSVEGAGLRMDEYNALTVLVSGGRIGMSELAGRLLADDSTTTRVVDGLEARGMVRREQDATDRRVRIVVVTRVGRAAQREACRRVAASVHEAVESLRPSEVARTMAGIIRLRDSLRERRDGGENG